MDDLTPPHWGTPPPMTELARRCEEAEGPSRELDRTFAETVWQALKGDHNDLRRQQIILRAHRDALAAALRAGGENG